MAETASSKPYQKLSGSGYRRIVPGWVIVLLFFVIGIFALLLRGRRVQLWIGDGHLLAVEWDGAREFYKRFRFDDIQAFTIRRTPEALIVNILVGAITAFFAVLASAVSDPAGRIFLLVLVGVFGLLLLGNLLSGPTCQCYLRTAVQAEEMPSLTRLRHARKALDRLRPAIVAAQGQFAPGEIAARLQDQTPSVAVTAAQAGSLRFVVDDPNAPPRIIS